MHCAINKHLCETNVVYADDGGATGKIANLRVWSPDSNLIDQQGLGRCTHHPRSD